MTVQYIACVGMPASGKSTWAKAWVAEDPLMRVRVNKDAFRALCNESVWSKDYEAIITAAQKSLIQHALKAGRSVVNDNTNFGKQHWNDIAKMVRELNVDCEMIERPFYVSLEEAIERDSKRDGAAKVGEVVIRKFWKQSGGESFKGYQPRSEVFAKRMKCEAPKHDPSLPDSLIVDLDGTLALIGDRSPYDAKDCDLIDFPHEPVCATIGSLMDSCYVSKVIFCSGREDKHEPETRRFIEKHARSGSVDYQLLMRKTGDTRPDDVVKEELYREHIEGKFNVKFVLDDRNKVVRKWRELGLTCFQVAEGDF